MGAVRKLFDDEYIPRRMKIPLQSEVARYMSEKMGWPMEFCLSYADKFWNYYNAQGWKLSNGNAMKDWQSAFQAQWKTIKNKEDIDLLNGIKAKLETEKTPEDRLNEILELHKKGEYKPKRTDVVAIYDYLKSKGLMKLNKEVINAIVERCGNDKEYGKMLAVRVLFDRYVHENKRF